MRANGERTRRSPCARALSYCAFVSGSGGGRLSGYLLFPVFLVRFGVGIGSFNHLFPDSSQSAVVCHDEISSSLYIFGFHPDRVVGFECRAEANDDPGPRVLHVTMRSVTLLAARVDDQPEAVDPKAGHADYT